MIKRLPVIWFTILFVFILSGCSSLLPSSKKDIKSPWNTFDEAKNAFDRIVPYKTTSEELKALGFDPFIAPNIKLLTYLDVIQRFMPNPAVKQEDLDEGLLKCIISKESCRAYEIGVSKVRKERFGNVMLDIFGFRRKTKISGWQFDSIIVMNNDLVVYKIWGGRPQIDELEDVKKPLGPLQNSGNLLKALVDI